MSRNTPRAYADDIAVVYPIGLEDLPVVVKLFSEFETFSGLRLNLQRSVVVPLHLCDLTRVHDNIARKIP